jgi:hypothetical protein
LPRKGSRVRIPSSAPVNSHSGRRSQEVKAGVCKTPIRRFESARRLCILKSKGNPDFAGTRDDTLPPYLCEEARQVGATKQSPGQIRNSKHETRNKYQYLSSKFKTLLDIGSLVIRYCLGFRDQDLGFRYGDRRVPVKYSLPSRERVGVRGRDSSSRLRRNSE